MDAFICDIIKTGLRKDRKDLFQTSCRGSLLVGRFARRIRRSAHKLIDDSERLKSNKPISVGGATRQLSASRCRGTAGTGRSDDKGEAQAEKTARRDYRRGALGRDQSVLATKDRNGAGAKGSDRVAGYRHRKRVRDRAAQNRADERIALLDDRQADGVQAGYRRIKNLAAAQRPQIRLPKVIAGVRFNDGIDSSAA